MRGEKKRVNLFNFTINYNTPQNGATPLFNGNIAQTSWNTASVNPTSNPVSNNYKFSYDAFNRLTSAIDNTGNYNLQNVTYDKNGNILRLKRNGHLDANATSFGVMDDLVYTYDNGNKLKKVLDNGNDNFGFKDGANAYTEYTYDANGSMKSDVNKGITNITYNHLNLPTQVTIAGKNINYTYDASGTKLRKTVENITTDYAGNFRYKNNVLEFFGNSEGYVTPNGNTWRYVYQYKDHLQNIRLSYTDNNGDGIITPSTEIIEETHNYPFGLKMHGFNSNISSLGNSTAQKFKYNSIEFEESLGLDLYEMDLRQYDPAIARWTSIDPVTHWSMSTYTAFDNNPVYWADPSGANSTMRVQDLDGKWHTLTEGEDYTTIYEASDNNDSTEDPCPPGDPNCSRGADGKIVNKYKMSVDTSKEQMQANMGMLLALANSDGALPFADVAAVTAGMNLLVTYAIAHGTVAVINSANESVLEAFDKNWLYAKQDKEIDRILSKAGGPPGMVYALTVNVSGTYTDVRGNSVYLNAGEVWKYGETTKGLNRYGQSKLDAMVPGGVKFNPLFFGNTVEIKVQEKIMIYGHVLATGKLPPGNKIFR